MITVRAAVCRRHSYRNLSRIVGKQTMWFPDRSDTNRPVQDNNRARSLKFWILVEKELYYPGSKKQRR